MPAGKGRLDPIDNPTPKAPHHLKPSPPREGFAFARLFAERESTSHRSNLRTHTLKDMLSAMRALSLAICLSLSGMAVYGQSSSVKPEFEVASVKPCQHTVGPDYNNQFAYTTAGMTARNATLKRLIAEAYDLQINQVSGPGWLDQNEFDIDARTSGNATKEQMALMLQTLLADRFKLKQHIEAREMRVYDLIVANSGPKIHPVSGGEGATQRPGLHFHGDLHRFADLLAVQFSIPAPGNPNEPVRAGGTPIPVLDKTGLPGIYDFSIDIRPEMGTDMFTAWQRVLQDQLGLRIESRKENVPVVVVDEASKSPTEN